MKTNYSNLGGSAGNTDGISASFNNSKTIEITNQTKNSGSKQKFSVGQRTAKFVGFLAFCVLMLQGVAFGQVASYTYATSVGTYTPITGTTWQSGATLATDAVSTSITLPWTFRYNNRNYNNLYISNNGFVAFTSYAANLPAAANITPISLTTASTVAANGYDGAISGFGCNLVASTIAGALPSIIYGTSGSDFVIQFTDVARTACPTTERFSFQIRLTQTTNVVKIIYGGTSCTNITATPNPQIGLRGPSYTDWKNLSAAASATAWSAPTSTNTAGTTSSILTIAFNSTSLMGSGRTYTYTPPTQLGVPTYATLPASTDFNTWINGTSSGDLPNANWRTWPAYGDRSWRINTIGAGLGWVNPTFGAPAVAAPASGNYARFHSYQHGFIGVMDYYVDFSGAGSKFMTFDFINTALGETFNVYLSTDGGTTFGASLLSISTAVGSWATQTVNLGTSTSATCVVRIEAKGDYGSTDIGVDNVSIFRAPTISSFSPLNLCPAGGQTITINGTNFFGVSGAAAVKFNGVNAVSYTVLSSTQIKAVSPSGITAGTITVTNAAGTGTSSSSFTLSTPSSPTTSPSTQCGAGVPVASASTANGTSTPFFNWYSASTGGTLLAQGGYVGPVTTTYYNNDFSTGLTANSVTGTVAGSPVAAIVSGAMQLTANALSQTGGFTVPGTGVDVDAHEFSFKLLTTSGGADGFSFNFGDDVATSSGTAEQGSGTKLSVTYNIYGTPGIGVKYGGTQLAFFNTNLTWIGTNAQMLILVNNAGQVTVSLNGTAILSNVQLPAAYLTANKSAWNFAFLARSGGIAGQHVIDDVIIKYASTVSNNTFPNSVSSTTTYFVEESVNGCLSARTSVTITVNSADALAITSSPASLSTVCLGSSFTLTPSQTGSNNNVFALTWAASTAGSGYTSSAPGTLGTPITITPTAIGTYTYTINGNESSSGCTGTASVTATVINPTAGISATASATPITVCAGSSTALDVVIGSTTQPTYTTPPAVANPTTDEDFGNITITTNPGGVTILNNTTAINSLTGTIGTATGTAGSYSNFTAFGPYTLISGLIYNYSVSSLQQVTAYGNALAIYIDYNRNGVFTDAGEAVYVESPTTTGAHTKTGTFTVPTGVSFGYTRMRVLVNEGAITGPTMTPSYGEYEEYLINLQPNITSYAWSNGVSTIASTKSTSPVVTASTNYTSSVFIGGCPLNTTVSVTSVPIPAAPSTNASTQCGAGIPTCSASGGSAGQYRWYTAPTGGTAIAGETNATLATYSVAASTTLYVAVNNGTCEGARTSVGITVNTADALAITSAPASLTNLCLGSSFTLTPSQTGSNNNVFALTWAASTAGSGYTSSAPGTLGTPITITPTAIGIYTYTINGNESSSGCTGTAAVTATVINPNVGISATATVTPTSVCNGSSTVLNVSLNGPQTQPTGYAASSATSTSDDEIFNVTINGTTLNNTSNCSTVAPGPGSVAAMYSNYTTLTPTNLIRGNSYTGSITIGQCAASAYSTGYAVFIDLNRDGTFGAGETMFAAAASATNAVAGTVNPIGSFTIPVTASLGLTRMRVVAIESSTGPAATGTYTWGETEDYVVNITITPTSYSWSNGTSVIGTTNPLTTTVTSNTSYTGTAFFNGCPVVSTPVAVINLPLPTAPTASSSVQCGTQIPTASVAGNNSQSSPLFNWYSASSGGTLLAQSGYSGPLAVYYSNDFSSSLTANSVTATVAGTPVASIQAGAMQLTANAISQIGGFTVPGTGVDVDAHEFSFKLLTTSGGADGFSFNFGDDVVSSSGTAEQGSGSKLSVTYSIYTNPGIGVKYNGIQLGFYNTDLTWRGTNAQMLISINSSGQITVSLNGTPVLSNIQLPASYLSANKAAWNFAFLARSGGVAGQHVIDDVIIKYPSFVNYLTYPNAISSTTSFYVEEVVSGCSSPRTQVNVTVNTPDALTATASLSPITCLGSPTNLNVTQTGTTNTYALTWSLTSYAGSGLSAPTPTTLNTPLAVTPTVGGATYTYTVTGVDATLGCTSVATVNVVVNTPPTPVATAATLISGTGFTANWNTVATATGYFLDVSTSSTFATFVSGYNNLNVGNVLTFNVSIPTTGVYYYRVRPATPCGGSNSNTITVNAVYCTPVGTAALYYVSNFTTTGGITNVNNTTGVGTNGAGYSNYAATQIVSQVSSGSVNFSITATGSTSYYYVWVDWNNDLDFDDAGENVFSSTITYLANVSGSFTVPSTVIPGNYRMRIVNSAVGTTTNCGPNSWGEYEDYTFNVPTPIPSITSFTPSSACPGTNVTITGSGFFGITSVKFGGVDAVSYTVNSYTSITAVAPNNSGVITILNSYGTGTSATSFTVNAAPATPTVTASGATTINVGGAPTLNATSTGGNISWFTTATGGTAVTGGNSLAPGTPYNQVQCTPGTYTLYAEEAGLTCNSARAPITFIVRPIISSDPANALICNTGGTVVLNANVSGGSSNLWSPGATLTSTSALFTTASPTVTTQYTFSSTVTGCGFVSGTQNVGVIAGAAFTPTATPAALCQGGTSVLASNLASAGFTVSTITNAPSTVPGTAVSLANGGPTPVVALTSGSNDDGGWGAIPLGFTYNFFGANYTAVNVSTNGFIQFGAYNPNGGFTVPYGLADYTYTTPFPTTLEPMNIVAGGACDLTITNGTVRYWTEGLSPTRVFVISYNVNGLGSGNNTFQIKLFETTGIVEVHVTSNTAQTGSNKAIGVNNFDGTVGNTAYNAAANLGPTAYRFIPGAAYTFQWSVGGSNASGTSTSTSYTTPVLNSPGAIVYTVAATNPLTQCASVQPVTITVNPKPTAPSTGGNVTQCSNITPQTLSVTAPSGCTIDWYAAASGGSILVGGTGTATFSTSTAGTYYAEARNATTGCTSLSRTAVTYTQTPAPAAPTVTTPVAFCENSIPGPLTATATVGNALSWYTVASGGTPAATATPSTATATTLNYYVSQVDAGNSCESNRSLLTVKINATPAMPVTGSAGPYCENASATALSATSLGANTLNWYTVATGGIGSGTAIIPATTPAATTLYYASQTAAYTLPTISCESARASISVVVNPNVTATVTNSASSTSACGGGGITFTATPTNGGSPAYQWYLNAISQPGEIAATYTLTTPTGGDQIYVEMTPSAQTCLTSAAATSSNIVPLTNTASTPTVSIQSSTATTVCTGTNVMFSVLSSSNMGATPTFQWLLNGSAISGEISSTYSTTGLVNGNVVSLEMTSSLSASCLTASVATSAGITYTINPATAITTSPVSAAVCLGGTQNFSVVATGTGTLTYQWKKNGVSITGNATAITNQLTLSSVSAGDVASYTVVVSSTCSSATSTAAALTLNTATSISSQPIAVTQCVGTTAVFTVVASAQGTLTYQWRKDGSPIGGEIAASLSVVNISLLNAGNYSVVVAGTCGSVTSTNALLSVNPATAISTQPSGSTVCASNTANFSVSATGAGSLTYQWQLNGTPISGAVNASLAVTNAQSANAGSYTVIVNGGCGNVTSNAAVLVVNPSTAITTQPAPLTVCSGQNATFNVVATGTGTLTYQWKKDGVIISGQTTSSLLLTGVTAADAATYSVVVSGGTCGVSSVSSNFASILTVNQTPTALALTGSTVCVGLITTITSTTSQSGVNYQLYNSSNTTIGSALAGTGSGLSWSSLVAGTGYYVFGTNATTSCSSTSNLVNVTVQNAINTTVSSTVGSALVAGDYLWNGNASNIWETAVNWFKYDGANFSALSTTDLAPTSSDRVFILVNSNAGSTCISASNLATVNVVLTSGFAKDIFIGTGATMVIDAGKTLEITGNWTNNGTFTPASSASVIFNGTGAQTIGGSSTTTFTNLTVNKSSGLLTLNKAANVSGTLTMTAGDIATTAANLLTVGTSAAAPGSLAWSSGSVLGPIKRFFSGTASSTQVSGIFPVGLSGVNRYAQVNYTSGLTTGGSITAEYKAGLCPVLYAGLPNTVNGQMIQNYENEGYWEITPNGGNLNTATYSLILRGNTLSTVTSPSFMTKLRIIKSTSHTSWEMSGIGNNLGASGGVSDFTIGNTGMTGFSYFNVGSGNGNALPVTLLSFAANCNEKSEVDLQWSTASEQNSENFIIERSRDLTQWEYVSTVNAAGNSNYNIDYSTVDNDPLGGISYYRLLQVDYNGAESIYGPISVSCSDTENGMVVFPNPTKGNFTVEISSTEMFMNAQLQITDLSGKVINEKSTNILEGKNQFTFEGLDLQLGTYIINLNSGNGKIIPVRIVVN